MFIEFLSVDALLQFTIVIFIVYTHEIINFVYIFSDLKSFRWEVLDVDGLQDAPNGLSPAEQVNIFSSFSDIESLKSSRSISAILVQFSLAFFYLN